MMVLVRHALPEVDDAVPSREWRLSEEGRRAARELGIKLAANLDIAAVVASDEPKTIETGEALGAAAQWPGEVEVDARLAEARRPWVDTGYRELAMRYLAGEAVDGWEPADDVRRRVTEAVAGIEARHPTGAVVVGHGLALTLYLQTVVPLFDSLAFWSALEFPDAWYVDRDGALRPAAR